MGIGKNAANIQDETSAIWSSNVQVYNFFSVFLERQVINIEHLDLSFTPQEYFDQILMCEKTDEGKGYLNLLMMLFTEYYQEKRTGKHKLSLPEHKYEIIAEQFLLYCRFEMLRREKRVHYLQEENLFDPNLKTVFVVDKDASIDSLRDTAKAKGITFKYVHVQIESKEKESV